MSWLREKRYSTERGERLPFQVALATLALCLIVAAFAAGAYGSCSASAAIRRPFTFTFVKTGGFVGVHDELVVDSSEKVLAFRSRGRDRRTVRATEPELRELEEVLKQANFMNIHRPYRCRGCADQFIYEATLKVEGSAEHKVHWEDDSGAPPALIALGALARRMIR